MANTRMTNSRVTILLTSIVALLVADQIILKAINMTNDCSEGQSDDKNDNCEE